MTPELIAKSLTNGYTFTVTGSDSPNTGVAVDQTFRSALAFENALNEALLDAPFQGRNLVEWHFATDDQLVRCHGTLVLDLSIERIDLTRIIADYWATAAKQAPALDVRTRARAPVMQYVAWLLRAEVMRTRVAEGFAHEQAARRALAHQRLRAQRKLMRTLGEAVCQLRILKEDDAFARPQYGVRGRC
jgi:hypothetical protein